MKFGKRLQELLEDSLPEWRNKFLSYKYLKKQLKRLPSGEATALSTSTDTDNNTEPEDGKGEDQQAHATMFVSLLNNQLEKLNDFFMEKEEEFVIRIHVLRDEMERLKAKNESDDLAQPASFEFEVTELHKAIVGLHGEMVLLENYSNLNYTGLVKILKKYDKRTGLLLRHPFINTVLSQPFLMTEILGSLVKECEQMMQFVFPAYSAGSLTDEHSGAASCLEPLEAGAGAQEAEGEVDSEGEGSGREETGVGRDGREGRRGEEGRESREGEDGDEGRGGIGQGDERPVSLIPPQGESARTGPATQGLASAPTGAPPSGVLQDKQGRLGGGPGGSGRGARGGNSMGPGLRGGTVPEGVCGTDETGACGFSGGFGLWGPTSNTDQGGDWEGEGWARDEGGEALAGEEEGDGEEKESGEGVGGGLGEVDAEVLYSSCGAPAVYRSALRALQALQGIRGSSKTPHPLLATASSFAANGSSFVANGSSFSADGSSFAAHAGTPAAAVGGSRASGASRESRGCDEREEVKDAEGCEDMRSSKRQKH